MLLDGNAVLRLSGYPADGQCDTLFEMAFTDGESTRERRTYVQPADDDEPPPSSPTATPTPSGEPTTAPTPTPTPPPAPEATPTPTPRGTPEPEPEPTIPEDCYPYPARPR